VRLRIAKSVAGQDKIGRCDRNRRTPHFSKSGGETMRELQRSPKKRDDQQLSAGGTRGAASQLVAGFVANVRSRVWSSRQTRTARSSRVGSARDVRWKSKNNFRFATRQGEVFPPDQMFGDSQEMIGDPFMAENTTVTWEICAARNQIRGVQHAGRAEERNFHRIECDRFVRVDWRPAAPAKPGRMRTARRDSFGYSVFL